jgi:hypothetical protein
MRAPRFRCAKPGSVLRMTAARFCLFVLAAAMTPGCAEIVRGQAQQPASPSTSQAAKPDSSQPNSGQDGAQDSQPKQNSGSNTGAAPNNPSGAPMTIGDGEDQSAPAEPTPAQPPAQAPAAQQAPAQPAGTRDDQPAQPVQQQTVPAAPAVASPESATPSLAALPPGPPDSSDPRKLVNWECADLLKMANDLKTAVDKTTKDELSLSVVRKANDIEQMAHKLRDDMRPAMAGKN